MRGAAVAATTALAVVACSSSLQPPDGGGLDVAGADASPDDAAVPAGGFITADVDGVTTRADMQAGAFFWSGIAPGWLGAEARDGEWIWSLVIRNMVGPSACSYAVLYPVGALSMSFASYWADGACDATVAAAAPDAGDLFEGTFSARLPRSNGSMPKTVVNGAFRLPRVDGIPPPL